MCLTVLTILSLQEIQFCNCRNTQIGNCTFLAQSLTFSGLVLSCHDMQNLNIIKQLFNTNHNTEPLYQRHIINVY